MTNSIELRLLTPEGELARTECDSVNLFARDNAKGEGGGSVGIRPGHLPAVIALEPGSSVTALAGGKEVLRAFVGGGFARVGRNLVVITAPTASGAEQIYES